MRSRVILPSISPPSGRNMQRSINVSVPGVVSNQQYVMSRRCGVECRTGRSLIDWAKWPSDARTPHGLGSCHALELGCPEATLSNERSNVDSLQFAYRKAFLPKKGNSVAYFSCRTRWNRCCCSKGRELLVVYCRPGLK
jgi:hypothetical protein